MRNKNKKIKNSIIIITTTTTDQEINANLS